MTVKNKIGQVYVVKKQRNYNEDDYENFRKEAEFLQKISHPNIVNLVESFVNPPREIIFILEYCASGDLSKQIKVRNE